MATDATQSFSSSSSAVGRRVSHQNSVASVSLKAKELEFVHETLCSYGAYEIVYSTWVKKINPKGKVQKRLLVLAPFHIFSFKMGAFGKKGLQRCGHYFELAELHAPKAEQLDIRFHTFNILFNSQEVGRIVRVIEGLYRGLHPHFPEHFMQQLTVNVDQKILIDPVPQEIECIIGRVDTFDNFWHIFCAWCNYYGIRDVKPGPDSSAAPFLPDFRRYLQRKFAAKDRVLDNPPLLTAVHFKALCKALYFDRNFEHLSLTDYTVASADGSLVMAAKELLPLADESIPRLPRSPRVEGLPTEPWGKTLETQIIELLTHTSSLTHLTLSSLPLGESFFKKLSECLKKRRSSLPTSVVGGSGPSLGSSVSYSTLAPPALGELELEHFSLAGTKLDEKSWKHLGEILKIIGNHISRVDFSDCGITHKGIAYLSEALIFATGANLQYLNLSHNALGLEGTSSLNHVISSGSCLYEIDLSNCALDIAEICKYVKNKGCGVRRLNISRNPLSEEQAEELVSLGLFTTTLRFLDVSYTGITAPKAAKLLAALHNNNELSHPVDLNLGGNPGLRPHIAPLASQLVVQGANRVGALILDDCDMQDEGMQALFSALTALTPDLQLSSLSVSFNLSKAKAGEEREKTAAAINEFLSKAGPSLEAFTMRGGESPGALSSAQSSPAPSGEQPASPPSKTGTLKKGGSTVTDAGAGRGTMKKASTSAGSGVGGPQLRFGPALALALECLASGKACPSLKRLDVDGNEAGDGAARTLIAIVQAHPALEELRCDGNAIQLSTYQELVAAARKSGSLVRLSEPVVDGRRMKDKDAVKRLVESIERFNSGQKHEEENGDEAKKKEPRKEKKKRNEKDRHQKKSEESEEAKSEGEVKEESKAKKGKEKKQKKKKQNENEKVKDEEHAGSADVEKSEEGNEEDEKGRGEADDAGKEKAVKTEEPSIQPDEGSKNEDDEKSEEVTSSEQPKDSEKEKREDDEKPKKERKKKHKGKTKDESKPSEERKDADVMLKDDAEEQQDKQEKIEEEEEKNEGKKGKKKGSKKDAKRKLKKG